MSRQPQDFNDGRLLSSDALEFTLELVIREFVIQSSVDGLSHAQEAAYQHTKNALKLLVRVKEKTEGGQDQYGQQPATFHSGSAGRPPFIIRREQLEFLVENQFSVPQMASMLGVSTKTVERQLSDYGISIRDTYTDMTNEELQSVVASIQNEHPMCGNRQMRGYLLARGFRVQQSRIREAQKARS